MTTPVIILGTGGHAKVLINALRIAGREIHGAVTQDETLWEKSLSGFRYGEAMKLSPNGSEAGSNW